MGFKIKGLDKAQREIKKFQKAANQLQGTNSLPLNEVLSESFMRKNTPYVSLEQLFLASGHKMDSENDWQMIVKSPEFNQFIASATKFNSWEDMLEEAGADYVAKKLGL